MNFIENNLFSKQSKVILAIVVCLAMLGGAIMNVPTSRSPEHTVTTNNIETSPGEVVLTECVSLPNKPLVSVVDGNCVLIVGRIHATPSGLFVLHDSLSGIGSAAGDEVSQTPLSLFLAERGFVAVQMSRQHAQTAEAMQQAQEARDFASARVEQAVPCETDFVMGGQHLRVCLDI